MKERPTSVTVFAVINLILSGLGLLGFIFWIISKLELLPKPETGQNPVVDMMENSQALQLFTDVGNVLGILVTTLMIAASIGMFMLKPWSRKLTIGLGVYGILMGFVTIVANYFLIWGPLLADTNGPERIGYIIALVFQAVFVLVFVGYYLLMIYMLNRAHVVDAFTPEPEDESLADWDSDTLSEGNEA